MVYLKELGENTATFCESETVLRITIVDQNL